MEKVSLLDVVNETCGKVVGKTTILNSYVQEVVTDSRVSSTNGLFFAIVGENTDGHNYISMAKENGAVAAVIEKELDNYEEGIVYILVENTLEALKSLATWYRTKFNIPVVAITGSVGKTTTKEMIASVLSVKYNVLKTAGNLNSEIGAPVTVLGLNSAHEIAVIEMGMDHLGQIDSISKIVKPDTAVISNIGVAHIEYLKTRENILKAKTEVFANMPEDGVAILNADDDMLVTITNPIEKVWYGYSETADIKAIDSVVDYTEGVVKAEVLIDGNLYELRIPGLSKHLVYAALTGIAVGLRYNMTIEEIIKGVESYKGFKMRMDVKKVGDNILLIDDTYNANPVSMKSLIDTVAASNRECKTIIMGDMYELGDETLNGHKSCIEYAIEKGITHVIVIGEHMEQAFNSLDEKEQLNVNWYKTKEIFYDHIERFLVSDSLIAAKASRGMKFENIVSKIIELV